MASIPRQRARPCRKTWRRSPDESSTSWQAARLEDLKAPPNNRLEAMKRDRKGQHAIRINDQYRICFVCTDSGPERVEITDYH